MSFTTADRLLARGDPKLLALALENRRREMPSQPRPLLGELLLRHGLISPHQLEEALAKQSDSTRRLGEILVEVGVISGEQLKEMLEFQERLARGEEGAEAKVHPGGGTEA